MVKSVNISDGIVLHGKRNEKFDRMVVAGGERTPVPKITKRKTARSTNRGGRK